MDVDIDDIMSDQEEHEGKEKGSSQPEEKPLEDMTDDIKEHYVSEGDAGSDSEDGRPLIGRVERFFSKLNVAAIHLTADLKIGDVIEIKKDNQSLRVTVLEMQINRVDVGEASEGDSIGIKVDHPVKPGSNVYLVSRPT